MTSTSLTAAQHAILTHAIHHSDGKIDGFPKHLKGAARKKVLDSLFNRALVTPFGGDWFIAAEGYDALGVARPALLVTAPEIGTAVTAVEATEAEEYPKSKSRTSAHSKQAQVIAMLKRPEGATILQLTEATGWLDKTVRGTFAGTFKKKLGLNLVSDKVQGGKRVYRLLE